MSERTIAKYDVPGFGEIKLFYNSEGAFHGHYYAWNREHGIFARFSADQGELEQMAGLSVETELKNKKKILDEQLTPVNETLTKMSICSMRGKLLDSFKVTQ